MNNNIDEIIDLDPKRIFDLTKNNLEYFINAVNKLFGPNRGVNNYERGDITYNFQYSAMGIEHLTEEQIEEMNRWKPHPSNPLTYDKITKERKGIFIGFVDAKGNRGRGVRLDYSSMPRFSFLRQSGLWVSKGLEDDDPFTQRHEEVYL